MKSPITTFCIFSIFLALAQAVEPLQLSIPQVQGRSSQSPYVDEMVTVQGAVTYCRVTTGYRELYLQAMGKPDGASTAVMIYTRGSDLPNLEQGTVVTATGRVTEFVSGENNPITEIVVPAERIEIVGKPEVALNPVAITKIPQDINQAIAFYESLEYVKVELENAWIVGHRDNLIYIVPAEHGGKHLNQVGGVTITAEDKKSGDQPLSAKNWSKRYQFNYRPERIAIRLPRGFKKTLSIGDRIEKVCGFLNLKFGVPTLEGVTDLKIVEIGADPETSTTIKPNRERLLIASYNIENFSIKAKDSKRKLEKFAEQIVHSLKSPDVLTLSEVGDDDEVLNSIASTVSQSTEGMQALIKAIEKQGGPKYRSLEKQPLVHEEGGRPGLNIRIVFLYNPKRVKLAKAAFRVPRASRPFEEQHAFLGTRKCLAAKFLFLETGQPFYAIGCHLKSKRGDLPTLSLNRDPDQLLATAVIRRKQTRAILNEVRAIREREPSMPIIVSGDFNDHHFSTPLRILTEPGPLVNLTVRELEPNDRFTYRYEGANQALDHMLVTKESVRGAHYDIIHMNSGENDDEKLRFSDHDPVLASILLGKAHDTLDAALWMQQAEYKVLTKSIFQLAETQLKKTLEMVGEPDDQKPLAVILDVDETVLDNSPFQAYIINRNLPASAELFNEWVYKKAAPDIAGASSYIKLAESLGVKPIFITNREYATGNGTDTKQATLENLRVKISRKIELNDLLLKGEKKHPEFPVIEHWTSEKESRRKAVREKYRIIQLIGDDLGDFLPDLKRYSEITPEQRTEKAMKMSQKWMQEWFMLPNPTYGSWKRTVNANDRGYVEGF